jgi:hypothetical protein
VGMTQHLNDMNLQLQGRNQLVNDIYWYIYIYIYIFAHVKAF